MLTKASHLAALVLALRPTTIVEIGVFLGGSLVPLALAQQSYARPGRERTIAIDPWAAHASVEGQYGANLSWWGALDHSQVYARFMTRLQRHGLTEVVEVVRAKSDEVTPPDSAQLIHIDGNHGEQALRDVERFAPCIPVGGVLILDDLQWEGGAVRAGYDRAIAMGFTPLYPLGTGVVLQRTGTT